MRPNHMSSLDFHNFTTTHPEYAKIWEILAELYSDRLYHNRYIDPRAVIRRVRSEQIEATIVMRALDALVHDGVLQQFYVLINPRNDDWLSELVDSPQDIPDVVHDFEYRVETDDADIVPLYTDREG